MKRLLVILCCLLLVGGLVAGCGTQSAEDDGAKATKVVVGCRLYACRDTGSGQTDARGARS